ncbi:hypothetical protein QR680_017120 [Steinernema hermaphroditum]|uniref:Uncharacterized protein n=1 Tax=Steinernema hermaphroditum TaxID=289476 RepID=A0AA39HED7_9BILA|nr:hypothetical protein QR680_017120 [Steinernema hermaphroditum]
MKEGPAKSVDFGDVSRKYRKSSVFLAVLFGISFGFATTTISTSRSTFASTSDGLERSKRSLSHTEPLRHFLPRKSLRGQLHFGAPSRPFSDPCTLYEEKYGNFSRHGVFTVLSWFPFCAYFVFSLFLVLHLLLVFCSARHLLSHKAKVVRALFHAGFALGALEILMPLNFDISEHTRSVPRWQITLTLVFFVAQTVLLVVSHFIEIDDGLGNDATARGHRRPFNLFFYIAALSILIPAFVVSSVHRAGDVLDGLEGHEMVILWISPENFFWRSIIPGALVFVIFSNVSLMLVCACRADEFYLIQWALLLHGFNAFVLLWASCIEGYYYLWDVVPNKGCALLKSLAPAIFDSFVLLTICCGFHFVGFCGLAADFYGKPGFSAKPKRKSAVVARF